VSANVGLGLGTVGTTALFIGTVLVLLTHLTRTGKDATEVRFGTVEDRPAAD
jgi:hypothetical protein